MSVREQLDQVSEILAEKLAREVDDEGLDENRPLEDRPKPFSGWNNGVGWGDFTRAMGRR